MPKRLAKEASHVGQTVAKGRIEDAGRDGVIQRLAEHGRLLVLLELVLITAAHGRGWRQPVSRVGAARGAKPRPLSRGILIGEILLFLTACLGQFPGLTQLIGLLCLSLLRFLIPRLRKLIISSSK